jgi:hypothetical protein
MECACGIKRTRSCYSTSTLSVVCVVDGSMPLLLLMIWDSLNFLRSYPISVSSFYSLSLWCAACLKSSVRQSWTIIAIISPSSFMIVYSSGGCCAFVFLHTPASCTVGLLVPLGSYVMGFDAVSCAPSAGFHCPLVH